MNIDQPNVDSISQATLRRIRRQNAALKCACLLAGLGLLWPLVGGMQAGSTIARANGFEVADPAGVLRASLGMSKDNSPELIFFNERGKEQTKLTATAKATRMVLQNGTDASIVIETTDDSSAVRLVGGNKGTSIILETSPAAAKISMLDQQSTPRLNLEINDKGQPMITMWDKEKNTRLTWTLDDRGPSLQVLNPAGEVVWEAKGDGAAEAKPASPSSAPAPQAPTP